MVTKTEVKKYPPPARPEDFIPDPNMSEEERAKRKRFAEKMRALQGKLQLNLDIDELRGRRRS
jgi:hypothetical protein